MKDIWDRIHVWLAAKAPMVLASLDPPATDEQLRAAEAAMGVSLPDDVKACYRIHDGQRVIATPVCHDPDLRCAPGFLYGEKWMSLDETVKRWRGLKERLDGGAFAGLRSSPYGPVRDDWWRPQWLPVTEGISGYLRCLDLAPAGGGHVGQLIYWRHNNAVRGVTAASPGEWVERFAGELERGNFVTDPNHSGPGLVRVANN